jgi:hypothetical protein
LKNCSFCNKTPRKHPCQTKNEELEQNLKMTQKRANLSECRLLCLPFWVIIQRNNASISQRTVKMTLTVPNRNFEYKSHNIIKSIIFSIPVGLRHNLLISLQVWSRRRFGEARHLVREFHTALWNPISYVVCRLLHSRVDFVDWHDVRAGLR